jgi:hypothetical protein
LEDAFEKIIHKKIHVPITSEWVNELSSMNNTEWQVWTLN